MRKVIPVMERGGNMSLQTHATGTNWVEFASQTCRQLVIVNDTGTKIQFVQDDQTGAPVTVFDQSSFQIYGIQNASQISIRRADVSNTQVTVQARWED